MIKSNLLTDEGSKHLLIHPPSVNDAFTLMGNCCTICSALFVNPHCFLWLGQSSIRLTGNDEKSQKQIWNLNKKWGGGGAMFIRKVKHSKWPSHKLKQSVELNNRMTHERGHLWQIGHSLQGPPCSALPPCRKQMCTQCGCIRETKNQSSDCY